MTDRYSTLTVILDEDIRDDDAEVIISAIKQIRHVAGVEGNISDSMDVAIAKHRLKSELFESMLDLMRVK